MLLVKNVDQRAGIVNGTAGTVVDFTLSKEDLAKKRLEMRRGMVTGCRKGDGGVPEVDIVGGEALPVVTFDNGVTRTMVCETWSVYGLTGKEVAHVEAQINGGLFLRSLDLFCSQDRIASGRDDFLSWCIRITLESSPSTSSN